MASTASNAIEIAAIQTELANSKRLSDLTDPEKRQLLDALPPGIVATNINYTNVKVGDNVYGNKVGINGGGWFFGVVLVAPPTTDAHIDFKYQS